MKLYTGVTDIDWYRFLSQIQPEEINFWQPGGNANFRVLQIGEPYLFKLKYPINAIAGVGFFVSHTKLPLSMAWDTFKHSNGTPSFEAFKNKILTLRNDATIQNPIIGCNILTNPVFFNEADWIEIPPSWKANIVQGKSYSTDEPEGRELWSKVETTLQKYPFNKQYDEKLNEITVREPKGGYGLTISKVRLGQGAFRVMVIDAYNRKCAISGEKTLPVLESSHIKPFSKSGPHLISNALLLRSDLHKLYDSGYMTITPDYKIEVSKRIHEDFNNGKEYYKLHGIELLNTPINIRNKPSAEFLKYHNENRYNG